MILIELWILAIGILKEIADGIVAPKVASYVAIVAGNIPTRKNLSLPSAFVRGVGQSIFAKHQTNLAECR